MISNVKRYDEPLCPPHALYLQTHHSSAVSFTIINLSNVVYICFLANAFGSECLIEIGTPGPSLNIVCGCLSLLDREKESSTHDTHSSPSSDSTFLGYYRAFPSTLILQPSSFFLC